VAGCGRPRHSLQAVGLLQLQPGVYAVADLTQVASSMSP